MNQEPRQVFPITFPPMPKVSDFGIEDWSGAADDPKYDRNKIFVKKLGVYNEALAAWERVCMAISGTINR